MVNGRVELYIEKFGERERVTDMPRAMLYRRITGSGNEPKNIRYEEHKDLIEKSQLLVYDKDVSTEFVLSAMDKRLHIFPINYVHENPVVFRFEEKDRMNLINAFARLE